MPASSTASPPSTYPELLQLYQQLQAQFAKESKENAEKAAKFKLVKEKAAALLRNQQALEEAYTASQGAVRELRQQCQAAQFSRQQAEQELQAATIAKQQAESELAAYEGARQAGRHGPLSSGSRGAREGSVDGSTGAPVAIGATGRGSRGSGDRDVLSELSALQGQVRDQATALQRVQASLKELEKVHKAAQSQHVRLSGQLQRVEQAVGISRSSSGVVAAPVTPAQHEALRRELQQLRVQVHQALRPRDQLLAALDGNQGQPLQLQAQDRPPESQVLGQQLELHGLARPALLLALDDRVGRLEAEHQQHQEQQHQQQAQVGCRSGASCAEAQAVARRQTALDAVQQGLAKEVHGLRQDVQSMRPRHSTGEGAVRREQEMDGAAAGEPMCGVVAAVERQRAAQGMPVPALAAAGALSTKPTSPRVSQQQHHSQQQQQQEEKEEEEEALEPALPPTKRQRRQRTAPVLDAAAISQRLMVLKQQQQQRQGAGPSASVAERVAAELAAATQAGTLEHGQLVSGFLVAMGGEHAAAGPSAAVVHTYSGGGDVLVQCQCWHALMRQLPLFTAVALEQQLQLHLARSTFDSLALLQCVAGPAPPAGGRHAAQGQALRAGRALVLLRCAAREGKAVRALLADLLQAAAATCTGPAAVELSGGREVLGAGEVVLQLVLEAAEAWQEGCAPVGQLTDATAATEDQAVTTAAAMAVQACASAAADAGIWAAMAADPVGVVLHHVLQVMCSSAPGSDAARRLHAVGQQQWGWPSAHQGLQQPLDSEAQLLVLATQLLGMLSWQAQLGSEANEAVGAAAHAAATCRALSLAATRLGWQQVIKQLVLPLLQLLERMRQRTQQQSPGAADVADIMTACLVQLVMGAVAPMEVAETEQQQHQHQQAAAYLVALLLQRGEASIARQVAAMMLRSWGDAALRDVVHVALQ